MKINPLFIAFVLIAGLAIALVKSCAEVSIEVIINNRIKLGLANIL